MNKKADAFLLKPKDGAEHSQVVEQYIDNLQDWYGLSDEQIEAIKYDNKPYYSEQIDVIPILFEDHQYFEKRWNRS